MCGINGIFSKTKIEAIDQRLTKMNEAIRHRGPDAGGIFSEKERTGLGHRRLSIIDTREQANQPMFSHSGRWVIVFNGEIYNFQEIKKQLHYPFQTASDTEVILAAVEENGIDWFLQQANGMFAIALFDRSRSELFLIRDRMGIKPLYFSFDGTTFVFSSEIKGLLNSGLIDAIFNDQAVDEYLANRYIRSPYTFFKSIYQVEPGTFLRLNNDLQIKKTTYWDLPSEFNTQTVFDEKALLHRFDEAITRAIRYRLIADVPLGTYLSGGVDSSLITAITARYKQEAVNTYTIGFPELNEFDYSEIVAKKYHTIHHKIIFRIHDYLSRWEQLITFKDAPLGVPNEIPLAFMSEKLKEKITVVLSGEGADELMGGYGRIFRSPFDYTHHPTKTDFYDYFISQYDYVPRHMRDTLLTTPSDYRKEFDEKIREEFKNKANEENVFRFFHRYHVKGLLQRVDTTTMQTAVEARVPFLDHQLIEFTYREIPYALKLHWKNKEAREKAKAQTADAYSEKLDIPKYLLRQTARKYLPPEIIDRKKVGFPVPLTQWFSELEQLARELLPQADWLKNDALNELIEKSKNESRAGQILWMFINIEIFRKNYFRKSWKW
ncbi:asparagine synthase (glutamine-hydrolyzing) [Candidatus Sulfidibacterium hydrothermale]|uniref:asparagine synthase (glutamine-hydrolyzing) n=1 Tax=Candidatus Sulfidibacterium hydrothermale TaxID=2875962 RepID=UPI001F0AEE55|nr:asparagine synthase (glutamine-hydrolyzing) [Candidatus Sulfidibacterium hydrothermale]UBM61658.1 asparagine synthase (glutamine-hydrolyzing) [Candidatus Sulfidibacterium hydrothermale]